MNENNDVNFKLITTSTYKSTQWSYLKCPADLNWAIDNSIVQISFEIFIQMFIIWISYLNCYNLDFDLPWFFASKPSSLLVAHSAAWHFTIDTIGTRVAKCHGYGGYIRVKKWEGWGKKYERTCNLSILGSIWVYFSNSY